MKILIAEDSLTMRNVIKGMLSKANYKSIIEASDGREVINIINKYPVDLILLDINMPKLDGKSVLRIIKNAKSTQHIPVIIVTSDTEKETVIECIRNGASGYLVKPFSWKALESKIDEVLKMMTQKEVAPDSGTQDK